MCLFCCSLFFVVKQINCCEGPTTLGQGHTGAEDKVSSAMHTMSLQCWDVEMLIRYLDEIFSFTSDMGTEVKITDYKIDRSNLRTVMPDWLADRRTRSPLVEEHSTSPAPERSPLLQCQGDHFLRNALPVSGVGHMIHNAVKGFADVLQHFAACFLQLKVVEMALKHKGRCERICATCLRGTPYAKHIDAFMILFSNPS